LHPATAGGDGRGRRPRTRRWRVPVPGSSRRRAGGGAESTESRANRRQKRRRRKVSRPSSRRSLYVRHAHSTRVRTSQSTSTHTNAYTCGTDIRARCARVSVRSLRRRFAAASPPNAAERRDVSRRGPPRRARFSPSR
jgi:hypothetical protein